MTAYSINVEPFCSKITLGMLNFHRQIDIIFFLNYLLLSLNKIIYIYLIFRGEGIHKICYQQISDSPCPNKEPCVSLSLGSKLLEELHGDNEW